MEDLQIIELYWERNEDAIGESRAKYGKMLYLIAKGILSIHEDSEECVSDTYRGAWNTMPPKRPDFLAAYLGRITRNLSINRWHALHAQKRGGGADILLSELGDCIPDARSVETEIETAELAGIICKWLRDLPAEDRFMFLRRYWFCDDLKGIAERCGMSPNRLAGRMFRLRRRLKKALTEEGVTI